LHAKSVAVATGARDDSYVACRDGLKLKALGFSSSSTQVPPALRMSVCRLGQEVIVRPRSTSHGGEDEGAGRRAARASGCRAGRPAAAHPRSRSVVRWRPSVRREPSAPATPASRSLATTGRCSGALTAPSTWYAAVAATYRKPSGTRGPYSTSAPAAGRDL
jgi:hypothetical protein